MGTKIKISNKKNILYSFISVIILCILLFPLYWILVTSLKMEKEIFRIPPTFWPKELNLKSYMVQLETGDFNMFRSFGNSMIISFGAMFISIVLAVPASYGIAKYNFKGKKPKTMGFFPLKLHLAIP